MGRNTNSRPFPAGWNFDNGASSVPITTAEQLAEALAVLGGDDDEQAAEVQDS